MIHAAKPKFSNNIAPNLYATNTDDRYILYIHKVQEAEQQKSLGIQKNRAGNGKTLAARIPPHPACCSAARKSRKSARSMPGLVTI